MCGRSSLTKTEKEIEKRFNATFYSEELERYNPLPSSNICPSQMIPVITNQDPSHLQLYRWGLIPSWAKDAKIGYKMFNARKETILEKPAFRQAAVQRRCMVVMDSFYEWKKEGSNKKPYRILVKNQPLISVAGLWEMWINPQTAEVLYSCTIITQPPNSFMAKIHNRMPAILTPESERDWIDHKIKVEDAMQLLIPIESDTMEAYEMDPVKGKPNKNGKQMNLFG